MIFAFNAMRNNAQLRLPPSLVAYVNHFLLARNLGFVAMLVVLMPNPAGAEPVNYGRGPNLNFFAPSIGTESFSPASGINCPTPSLGIGAFGGGGNDWSDNYYPPYASSSSGVGNYGVALGLRFPLAAAALTKACKDYAKALAVKEQINTNNFARNSQISLLRQCFWLLENKILMNQPSFTQPDGAFSSLKPCSELNFEAAQAIINRGDGTPRPGDSENKPPMSEVLQPTTQTLQVEGFRR